MLPLGLSAADQQAFHAALASSHSIKIRVQILDLQHRALDDVSDMLIDGAVNVDRDAEVTRSCSMTLADPNRILGLDAASPDKGVVYLNRMIRVLYCVKSPTMADWVSVPVFTGPVTKVSRSDDTVSVECQGKEALSKPPMIFWSTFTLPAGIPRTDAIQACMLQAGENRFDIVHSSVRLPNPSTISGESAPWDQARYFLGYSQRQMFYDGRGYLRLRPFTTTTQFTFRTGDGGTITGYPQVEYNADDVRNIVLVKGPIVAGSKTPIRAFMAAPISHPLSEASLARGSVPGRRVEIIEDDSIRSHAEALSMARARLDQLLMQAIDMRFESLVIPHLEPGDLIRVVTPEFSTTMAANAFTIPLVAGESMSIGYLKRRRLAALIQPRQWANWPAHRNRGSVKVRAVKAGTKKKPTGGSVAFR